MDKTLWLTFFWATLYTTTQNTLISSLSLNHHFYASDTQLFSRSILATLTQVSPFAHLQTALKQISSWMSANLLTYNSSNTEFLIIGYLHGPAGALLSYHRHWLPIPHWFRHGNSGLWVKCGIAECGMRSSAFYPPSADLSTFLDSAFYFPHSAFRNSAFYQ